MIWNVGCYKAFDWNFNFLSCVVAQLVDWLPLVAMGLSVFRDEAPIRRETPSPDANQSGDFIRVENQTDRFRRTPGPPWRNNNKLFDNLSTCRQLLISAPHSPKSLS